MISEKRVSAFNYIFIGRRLGVEKPPGTSVDFPMRVIRQTKLFTTVKKIAIICKLNFVSL